MNNGYRVCVYTKMPPSTNIVGGANGAIRQFSLKREIASMFFKSHGFH
jgi:hypothetical protein